MLGRENKLGKRRIKSVFKSVGVLRFESEGFLFLCMVKDKLDKKRFAIIFSKRAKPRLLPSKKNKLKRIFFHFVREIFLKGNDGLFNFWCVCACSVSNEVSFRSFKRSVESSLLSFRKFLEERIC